VQTKRGVYPLALALWLVSNPIIGLSQESKDSEEHAAFVIADQEKNLQTKLKLLDAFFAKYPNSALLPEVIRDYFLTYFAMENYPRTIEYVDKYLSSNSSIDPGDRLEALATRARAFLDGCSDPALQTREGYIAARTAAVDGLRAVAKMPIDDIEGDDSGALPPREHEEALFYTVGRIAVAGLKGNKDESCTPQKIQIKNIKLFSRTNTGGEWKYTPFEEFREAKDLRLSPSTQFEAMCNVKGEPDLITGDFLLWTTVEFLVAPAHQRYEKLQPDTLASEAGWGTLAEMADLKPVPIYSLSPGETRRLIIKGFDLKKAIAAFPIGNARNLWPWLVRLEIHVQDRNGKQIGSAERVVRLIPDPVREEKPYQSQRDQTDITRHPPGGASVPTS
jgi:hypothetical protein